MLVLYGDAQGSGGWAFDPRVHRQLESNERNARRLSSGKRLEAGILR